MLDSCSSLLRLLCPGFFNFLELSLPFFLLLEIIREIGTIRIDRTELSLLQRLIDANRHHQVFGTFFHCADEVLSVHVLCYGNNLLAICMSVKCKSALTFFLTTSSLDSFSLVFSSFSFFSFLVGAATRVGEAGEVA